MFTPPLLKSISLSRKQDFMLIFYTLVTADDAESVCSCTEREGDAFPKAFERDLVTPTNLDEIEQQQQRSAEERRKSLLDHHWAIPSRDRQYVFCFLFMPFKYIKLYKFQVNGYRGCPRHTIGIVTRRNRRRRSEC